MPISASRFRALAKTRALLSMLMGGCLKLCRGRQSYRSLSKSSMNILIRITRIKTANRKRFSFRFEDWGNSPEQELSHWREVNRTQNTQKLQKHTKMLRVLL